MALVNKKFSDIITFSRASNATVTGSDGLIQYAPHNLLTYSEQFDNAAWPKQFCTVSANTLASPDGTVTADKLIEDTSVSSPHNTAQSASMTLGVTYTASVYAKKGERRYIFLRFISGGAFTKNYVVIFDLQTGTATNSSIFPATSFSITDVGNGWYRCSITQAADATGSGLFGVYLSADGAGSSYTGDGVSGLYIWGAQLSVGPRALSYTPTTSAAVYGPRFDYDPVSMAPKGLLVEEQRTNLCLYSGSVGGTSWNTSSGGTGVLPVVTLNAASSPDGTVTASRIQLSLGGGTTTTDQSLVAQASTGTSCRGSFYVKTADGTTKTIYVRGTNATSITVNGEWQRYDFDAGTLSGTQFGIGLRGGQGVANSNTADLLVWGAQLEAGAFATSYIPTVASQVTRSADVASVNTLSPWFNATEGTLYTESQRYSPAIATQAGISSLADSTGSTDNLLTQLYFGTSQFEHFIRSGAATSADLLISNAWAANTSYKNATAYKVNDFAATCNGAAVVTDSSGSVPTNIALLDIGKYRTYVLNGHIRRIAYFPRRLTNSELQALTA